MVAIPVPERVTVKVAPVVELLTIFNAPLTAPAVFGAKVIGIVIDCPEATALGMAVEAIENPVPVTDTELIVTALLPDEVTVTDKVFEVPSFTLP